MSHKLFIAGSVPWSICQKLSTIREGHETPGVVWEEDVDMHIKLRMFGDVKKEHAKKALRRLSELPPVKNVYMDSVVRVFEKKQLYVRVLGLSDLVDAVTDKTWDVQQGPRYTSTPHITLARSKNGYKVPIVEELVTGYFDITMLELWSCDKDSSGHRTYDIMEEVELGF
jgi:2'-5' RNA ligase